MWLFLCIAMRGQTHLQLATEQSKLYGVGNLDAVARKARELQVGGHLIITAGDAVQGSDSFLAHLYALGLKNTLIMSFDDELLVIGYHGGVGVPKDGSIPGCSKFRQSGSLRVLRQVTKHAGILVSLLEAANAAHGPPSVTWWTPIACSPGQSRILIGSPRSWAAPLMLSTRSRSVGGTRIRCT